MDTKIIFPPLWVHYTK